VILAGLALLLQSADVASLGQGSDGTVPPMDGVSWVKAGSIWHYSNTGTDQGDAWRLPDFSVADWPSGPAQLGYGDGDEATLTREGRPPHPLTAYFRTEFQVDRASASARLILRLVRDDGAVVYLNGKELLRDNMPAGEVRFDTPAEATAPDENAWRTFEADTALLVDGRNVLAVEVHQASAASSDMSFDIELIGHPAGLLSPVVSISAADAEAREMAPMLPAFDNAVFRLDRTGDASGELTVFFSVSGTAEAGVDYESLGNSVTFKDGQRSVDLEVVVLDDLLVEGDEGVVVRLEPDPSMGPVERYRVNPQCAMAKAVIHDNDGPSVETLVKIVAPQDGARFPEGDVIRIAAWAVDPVGFIAQLEYFADGTKIGESSVGWPECVGCEPKPGDPARHEFEWKGAGVGRHEVVAQATRRIMFQPRYEEQILDPPAVSAPVSVAVIGDSAGVRFRIAATRPVAEESAFPYRRLPLVGEFTISRTGDLTQPATVFVHYSGSAENGVDCEPLPSLVTIPAGKESMSLEVKAIPDKALERSEKLVARLSACPPRTDPPPGVPCLPVRIDPEHSWAVVTICDDARCGQAATLQITSPRDDARFPVGAPITLNAVAIDPLGAITRVEFWAGEQQIGVSEIWFFRAPDPGTPIHHEFVWSDAKAGAHTLTARAKDSVGLDVASSPVRILVRDAPAGIFVERDLPAAYTPGVAFEVRLAVAPPGPGNAWAVADQPPAGWSVADISDGGVFDATRGQVKFGPCLDLTARTLTYRSIPPSDAQGRCEFSGEAAFDGTIVPIGGDSVIESSTQTHPADLDPQDFAIGLGEVTAYAAAWKQGATWTSGPVPIPLDYVTRAGQIWRQGEFYAHDPGQGPTPECWVPTAAGGGPGLDDLSAHRIVRSFAGPGAPGDVLEVRIAVTPDGPVGAFAIEERVPEGWTFVDADPDATCNPADRQIRWGPFYTADPTVLKYRIGSPVFAASFAPFSGRASFDGHNQPILGARSVLAEDASTAVRFQGITRGAGTVRFVLGGPPGQVCQIESSTDLIDWTPHRRVFVLDDGTVEVQDDALPARARFFRVRPVGDP